MGGKSTYAKSTNGLIHLVHPAQNEFTMCGDAFDISETEDDADGSSWTECSPRPVTCPLCAQVVLHCRGVKISKTLRTDDMFDRNG
jgi:hypothetical protein